jgi:hypothetical protein
MGVAVGAMSRRLGLKVEILACLIAISPLLWFGMFLLVKCPLLGAYTKPLAVFVNGNYYVVLAVLVLAQYPLGYAIRAGVGAMLISSVLNPVILMLLTFVGMGISEGVWKHLADPSFDASWIIVSLVKWAGIAAGLGLLMGLPLSVLTSYVSRKCNPPPLGRTDR